MKPFSYNSEIGNNSFSGTKGLVTGAKTKVLETTTFLTSTSYYDDRYRVIQTLRDLFSTTATDNEVVSILYDFPGKVKQTKQAQTVNSVTTMVDKFYTYDHAGRLKTTEQQIAGDANGKVTISENSYNEIGQLIDKKLHKTNSYDYLQSVDYTYNIRGWLTSINNPDNPSQSGDLNADLFGEKLIYQTPEPGLSGLLQYNGNISAMVWKSTDKTKQGYAFTYDGLNRLTSSDHQSYPTTVWVVDNNYEEKSLVYDMNGNINRLIRTNSTGSNMADYTYTYSGNKLSNINSGTAYAYDLNGNTTTDGLRNVSIAYNILNLPKLVSKGTESISYIYSAAGEKLAKKMKDGTYQYYAGNMVYKNDKSLNYLLFDEGLVNKVSGGYAYEYHLKDHLGNTRVTFQPNGSATTTTQVAEYYPFGSSYLPVSPAGTNKYLYNGKEKQDDVLSGTALDWYDYGARFYDPVGKLGWLSVDPMAEWHFNATPYHYCFNNPINLIDPLGLDTVRRDPEGLPHRDLPAVEVTAPKHFDPRNWFNIERMLIRSDYALTGHKGELFEYGWHMYSSIGQGTPDKAKITEELGNIDALMSMMGSATVGPFKPGALDPAKIVKLAMGIIKENKSTSDEKIMDEHGGTQKTKIDANGQPISTDPLGYQQTESDSTIATYTLMFDEVNGNTYQDAKVHKNTHMGRYISKPYNQKTK